MNILFLQKRLLFPADTGGKIRTLNILRHLARWHAVTYVSNLEADEAPFVEPMKSLGLAELITFPWQEVPRHSLRFYASLAFNLGSRYPYTVNKDFDSRIRELTRQRVCDGQYDLLICDFVQMARNAIGIAGVPKLLFQHNVEAQIYQRLALNEPNPGKRWFIDNQYRKMQQFEARAGADFDRVIAVSDADKKRFESEYGWTHVDVIDTAVDTDYFSPTDIDPESGKIVFVGSMDWLPNQSGVKRFVKQILPRIRERVPVAKLEIVGRNPTREIRELASHAGVSVTGTVPDIRPHLASSAVAVVPIYAGGGTRLKIFEFLATGVPTVSTSIGAEGLDLAPGEHFLRADTDDAFANAVVELLLDPDRRQSIAKAAREHVVRNFGAERIARQFETICQRTVELAR